MPMHVELVSPERVAYSGDAKMVIARTVSGDIAFLNGHVPFIGVLETWPVRVIRTSSELSRRARPKSTITGSRFDPTDLIITLRGLRSVGSLAA